MFFAAFIVYHIIFNRFFPVDENNVLQAPDWYIYLDFLTGIVAAFSDKLINAVKLIANKVLPRRKEIPVDPIIENYHGFHNEHFKISEKTPDFKLERDQVKPTVNSIMESVDSMDGHDFEYWTADLLRKIGFSHVEVTPGSGDQGVDVLAEKDGVRYAVQCKRYSHDLGNTPVQEVHAGKAMYNCHVGIVITNQHFTAGAKQLAQATGVLLWDRDWIRSHLETTDNQNLP